MKNKTVVVVLVAWAILFIYIFFVDGLLLTTDEARARSENVFMTLRADNIDKIELTGKKGSIVLTARGTGKGETPQWHITSPVKLEADGTEVQALISAMDFLIFERKVDADPSEKRFGLNSPRLQGTAYFKGNKIHFSIGANAPGTQSVYLRIDSEKDHFYVVSADFFNAMDKGVDDLRDKHLLRLNGADVTQVSVQTPSGQLLSSRDAKQGQWTVRHQGHIVAGAHSELQQLVQTLANVKVSHFVSDNATDMKSYGFAQRAVSVELKSNSGHTIAIELGGACQADDTEIYVHIKGSKSVHCVHSQLLSTLSRPTERYFEKRLVTVAPEQIAQITLTEGNDRLQLTQKDGEWSTEALSAAETSQTAFSQLLEELKNRTAQSIVFSFPGSTESSRPNLPSTGMPPKITATIKLTDGTSQKLLFFAQEKMSDGLPDSVWVEKEGFSGWLQFPADVLSLVAPFPLRFRIRQLDQCNPEDVTAVQLRGSYIQQTLEKTDGDWIIQTPVRAKADVSQVSNILDLMCHTPVAAYVSDGANRFGGDKTFGTITATFTVHQTEGNRQNDTASGNVTLELGELANPTARFARIQSRPEIIFTIETPNADFLKLPLAARNLLAVQSDIISKIRFESKNVQFAAIKQNGRWQSADCPLQADAMERAIIDFGAVKAIQSQQFNPASTGQTATVKFSSEDNQPAAILHFFNEIPEIDGVVTVREGLDISFVLPARLLRDMNSMCANQQELPHSSR